MVKSGCPAPHRRCALLPLLLWAACARPDPTEPEDTARAPVIDDTDDTPPADGTDPEPTADPGVYVELPNGAVYDTTGDYQRALDGRLVCHLLREAGALDLVAVGLDAGVTHTLLAHAAADRPVDLERARDYNLDALGDVFLFGDEAAIWQLDAPTGAAERADLATNLYQSSWWDDQIVLGGSRVFADWDALLADDGRRYDISTAAQLFAGDGGFTYSTDHLGERLERWRYAQGDTVPSYAVPRSIRDDLYFLRAFDVVGDDVILFGEFNQAGGPRRLELRWFHGPTGRPGGAYPVAFVGEAQGVACVAGRAHPSRADEG